QDDVEQKLEFKCGPASKHGHQLLGYVVGHPTYERDYRRFGHRRLYARSQEKRPVKVESRLERSLQNLRFDLEAHQLLTKLFRKRLLRLNVWHVSVASGPQCQPGDRRR